MKRTRVMIVEDSHVVQEFLQHMIGQDPRLEVAAAVTSAEDALRLLGTVAPDVVSMDVRLPGMNGLEATERIMRDRPTPIVIVSASVDADDLQISMNALRCGALAVVEKPVGTSHRDYQAMASRLCDQLAVMSQVKVVRQRLQRSSQQRADRLHRKRHAIGGPNHLPRGPFHLLGIVASTGGPAALQKLLSKLDPSFPLPVALVQHMAEGFHGGFVSWLTSVCPLRVIVPQPSDEPQSGILYVAPSDRHLRLERGRWQLDGGPPVNSQRPSGTVLFRSLAASLGPRAVAVLLTGMGEDGAAGLKELRDAGGYTIAEDESTAVVYGMPGAAVKLGAVCESLPLDQIGRRLEQLAHTRQEIAG